jgi:hypothetical protein
MTESYQRIECGKRGSEEEGIGGGRRRRGVSRGFYDEATKRMALIADSVGGGTHALVTDAAHRAADS